MWVRAQRKSVGKLITSALEPYCHGHITFPCRAIPSPMVHHVFLMHGVFILGGFIPDGFLLDSFVPERNPVFQHCCFG